MTMYELMKQAAEEMSPPSAENIIAAYEESKASASRVKRKSIKPLLVAAAITALLGLTIGAAVGINALAAYFGARPAGSAAPVIIEHIHSGGFDVEYTDSWYSDGIIYLAGRLLTPEPLGDGVGYAIYPAVTVNGEPVSGCGEGIIYPDGSFVLPIFPKNRVEGNIRLKIGLDAIEYRNTSADEYNKSDMIACSGDCRTEMELSPAIPEVLLNTVYHGDGFTVNGVYSTAFTVMIKGEGLDGTPSALELEDGSLIFGCSDGDSILFRFDKPGQSTHAAALIFADSFYLMPGNDMIQSENPIRIPLR